MCTMNQIQAFLLCTIAFSLSLALPQYSTGLPPQYSTAVPQYSTPVPVIQYSTAAPQYSPSQPPYNQYQTPPVPILKQEQELNPDGNYHYSYQTGNGIEAEEHGAIKNLGSPDNEINSVQGYFSYPGLDGVQYSLTYTADENGFVPQGAHLPTPPPVPAELLKAYAALPPDTNEYDDKGFPIVRQGQQGFSGRQ